VASIVITEEAFEAIKATMPLGSVGFEKEVNAKGERTIWLEPHVPMQAGTPSKRT
jgi:hypothetical protein